MHSRERYLAIYDDRLRLKLDKVPKFVQYVRNEFITKNKIEFSRNSLISPINNNYFKVPYDLGFDAVFAPFPLSVKVRSIKIEKKNGNTIRIGEDGQAKQKKTAYYEGGFIHSLEILDDLRSNMKIIDRSEQILKIIRIYERLSKNIFPILMVDGLFDRIWKSMGMDIFSRNFRKKTRLYQELIKFYAEITRLNIEGLINATGNRGKVLNILDDMAYKGRTIISPERWSQDFSPIYRDITAIVKDAGLISQLHSDGDVTELIPSIIKAGFQGLQGWEGGCNPYYINNHFPNFVVIGFGDVSQVLPYGNNEQIIQHVKDLMKAFKENRHFIIGPSTVVHEKIPLKNIKLFISSADKFGKY
ncbi:MAG: uroporphyrinogen decarboxylase family protein [Promethearchaeota archaeon]